MCRLLKRLDDWIFLVGVQIAIHTVHRYLLPYCVENGVVDSRAPSILEVLSINASFSRDNDEHLSFLGCSGLLRNYFSMKIMWNAVAPLLLRLFAGLGHVKSLAHCRAD